VITTKNREAGVSLQRACLAWVLAVCLLPVAASAAESELLPPAPVPELRRELAGHNFIPSKYSLDPFVSTYAAAETGFGYGSAPGRTFDINGKPIGTADYKAGAFAQYVEFQYGFVDWWAVRAQVKILVYTGLNASGLAGIGTNVVANPSFGTTVSFKVGDRVRLGGSLDVSFGPAVFFNIVQAVKESIANGDITTPVNSYGQFTLSPAFVGSWAISKPLGVTFSATYQYTHASDDTVTTTASLLSGNILFDFDMGELNWVPIGLIGGFSTSFAVSDTKFLSFRYQFGIFYTGVRPLNVGFEVVYNRAPVVGNSSVFLSSLVGLLVLQYNFN
jgi:hypothetical protein